MMNNMNKTINKTIQPTWMIEAQNITFHHADLSFNFSCQIQKGEAIALVGANGAGKSTFLKLLAGFLKIESGTLFLNGKECTHLPVHQRPIAFLFQENNLFEHLTVEQNLSLALSPSLKLKAEQRQTLVKLSTEMQLLTLLPQKAETLSGGQKQKVALARALLQDRPILLLDEPFSALDETTKRELFELLLHYQHKKQLTLMMITHHLEDLVYFNQNQLRIEAGKII